jgi:uncharacterized membrane protein
MKELLAEEREIMMMSTKDMNEHQFECWKDATMKIMERRSLARQVASGGASATHGGGGNEGGGGGGALASH